MAMAGTQILRDFHLDAATSEAEAVARCLSVLDWSPVRAAETQKRALAYITEIRSNRAQQGEIENFLQNYPLQSPEGRALMTLAEALLRIPDGASADMLIAEKLAVSDWKAMGGEGFFAKATGFGLGLAKGTLGSFMGKLGAPVIRKATAETVRRLGGQFVVGETIEDALKQAKKEDKNGYRMSFDMLGEGARTLADAKRYFEAYVRAAHKIGEANDPALPLEARHGMSVKLSALHPRYQWAQSADCVESLVQQILELAKLAKHYGFTLTVDAEESERLELSLEIIFRVLASPDIRGWDGFGLAVQAYDRRCLSVLDAVIDEARRLQQKIQIRLVKGAYWDGEIKRAQVAGWDQYPVYTRKIYTDLSYLAAAKKMLAARDIIRPMFATHNAQTAAAVVEMAGADIKGFECQRLFGMGQGVGHILRHTEQIPVTLYAPVGSYEDLLPYLVRRMLENGANTSFVSHIRDEKFSREALATDPVLKVQQKPVTSALPLPPSLYPAGRKNAAGFDLGRSKNRTDFFAKIPENFPVTLPPQKSVDQVFADLGTGFKTWSETPALARAVILRNLADLMEKNTGSLMALLAHEGKKTLPDAIAEIREAVDFCRYYAQQGERIFAEEGETLVGPTGEKNILRHRGRGVFVCISPWNFPLAIFLGQVSAALMAGNSVAAKPAEQTPQIAAYVTELFYQAGLPRQALVLVTGAGDVGAALVAHPAVAGVAFTGSTEVAQSINRALAQKTGPIVPLIAETGGQNAMIVDSTALPEQVVDDVITSAFGSAGQRCSALRVLFVQEDIALRVLDLLQGAMAVLKLGDPSDPATDIGPVIDEEALQVLLAHKKYLDSFARKIAEVPVPSGLSGTYFAPVAYEIDHLKRLNREVFGPVLHVIRFKGDELPRMIEEINATGYGLTFGLHSRLEGRYAALSDAITAGNVYINRSMIGAVVGVQPFGGSGLSGTGPKAGGPHYLLRFATEQAVSINTMATGGNVDLIASLED